MPTTVFGVPAHPLIVHAVVVLVPLAALGAILAAVWPRFRGWVGWLVAAAAALDVLLVPMATASGENLERQVRHTDLVERHTQMAEQLLPWVIVLAVGVVALMARERYASRQPSLAKPWLAALLAVVTVVGGAGALVQAARIGHSGAKAVWSNQEPVSQP